LFYIEAAREGVNHYFFFFTNLL